MEREQRQQHIQKGLSGIFPESPFAIAIVNGDGSTNYGGAWDGAPTPVVRRIAELLGEAAYSRPAVGFGSQDLRERLSKAFTLEDAPPRGFVLAVFSGNDVELAADVRQCSESEWRWISSRLEEIQSGLKHWIGRSERQRR